MSSLPNSRPPGFLSTNNIAAHTSAASSAGPSSSSVASASTSSSAPPPPDVKEFVIRVPKNMKKHHHVMRFNATLNVDFAQWKMVKLERENNLKEFKGFDEDMPKFGAGSEYNRELREEVRRKKYGIVAKRYKPEAQPWILKVGGKSGKKFRGIREGGVGENAAFYVFAHAPDGAIEAYPLNEWYNFQPIQRYKALSAEEAEHEFGRRKKVMNFFSLMLRKRMKGDEDGEPIDAEETKLSKLAGKKSSKELKISDMDEWIDSDDDESSDDGEEKPKKDDADDSDEAAAKKKKKGKKGAPEKKKKKRDLDDEAFEESDDGDEEGRELDYISDSSDSEPDPESKANKEMKSVAEEDALRKLLTSDDDSDEEKKSGESDKEDADAKKAKEKQEAKEAKEARDKHKKKKLKKKREDTNNSKKVDTSSELSSNSSDSDDSTNGGGGGGGGAAASMASKNQKPNKKKNGSAATTGGSAQSSSAAAAAAATAAAALLDSRSQSPVVGGGGSEAASAGAKRKGNNSSLPGDLGVSDSSSSSPTATPAKRLRPDQPHSASTNSMLGSSVQMAIAGGSGGGGGGAGSSGGHHHHRNDDSGITEEAVRRYLMRKPMTTTELLTKFKNKKTGVSSEKLVETMTQILKRINPFKQTIQGKMYLSIKTK